MKKVETGLSIKEIQKENIEVKITQNDVIELLVQEQVDALESKYNELCERYTTIQNKYKTFFEKVCENKVLLTKVPLTASVADIYHTANPNTQSVTISCPYFGHGSTLEQKYVSSQIMYAKVDIFVNTKFKVEVDGVIFYSGNVKYDIDNVLLPEELMNEINDYAKDFRAFNEILPDRVVISKITKQIKATFTKQILSTTSAAFRKKLSQQFNVKL